MHNLVECDHESFFIQLIETAFRSYFLARSHENFQFGIRKNCCAYVAAVHYNTFLPAVRLLLRNQPVTDGRNSTDGTHPVRDFQIPDFFSTITSFSETSDNPVSTLT